MKSVTSWHQQGVRLGVPTADRAGGKSGCPLPLSLANASVILRHHTGGIGQERPRY